MDTELALAGDPSPPTHALTTPTSGPANVPKSSAGTAEDHATSQVQQSFERATQKLGFTEAEKTKAQTLLQTNLTTATLTYQPASRVSRTTITAWHIGQYERATGELILTRGREHTAVDEDTGSVFAFAENNGKCQIVHRSSVLEEGGVERVYNVSLSWLFGQKGSYKFKSPFLEGLATLDDDVHISTFEKHFRSLVRFMMMTAADTASSQEPGDPETAAEADVEASWSAKDMDGCFIQVLKIIREGNTPARPTQKGKKATETKKPPTAYIYLQERNGRDPSTKPRPTLKRQTLPAEVGGRVTLAPLLHARQGVFTYPGMSRLSTLLLRLFADRDWDPRFSLFIPVASDEPRIQRWLESIRTTKKPLFYWEYCKYVEISAAFKLSGVRVRHHGNMPLSMMEEVVELHHLKSDSVNDCRSLGISTERLEVVDCEKAGQVWELRNELGSLVEALESTKLDQPSRQGQDDADTESEISIPGEDIEDILRAHAITVIRHRDARDLTALFDKKAHEETRTKIERHIAAQVIQRTIETARSVKPRTQNMFEKIDAKAPSPYTQPARNGLLEKDDELWFYQLKGIYPYCLIKKMEKDGFAAMKAIAMTHRTIRHPEHVTRHKILTITDQDIAQLVDTALRKIETEDADSQVRADVWMFWAHNFKMSKPDSGLAKGYLKEKPNFSQEDKGRFEEHARNIELTVIFFMQRTSLCQGAAGRRKRKRDATENTGNPSQAEKALSDYIRSRAKKVDALPKVEAKLAQVEAKLAQVEAIANEKLQATRMQAKKELDTASAELKSVKSQLATTNQKNEDLLSRIAGLEREVEAAKLGTK
ncbi:hypothetical protein SLS60_007551 [Paraconiothyrium brasiliense]|uniref:Uncharacterized protein n=1 Tax=Paraconiothyrium brasiliense TaxID=300254 RepID=A0ABR3R5V1_9PLEO